MSVHVHVNVTHQVRLMVHGQDGTHQDVQQHVHLTQPKQLLVIAVTADLSHANVTHQVPLTVAGTHRVVRRGYVHQTRRKTHRVIAVTAARNHVNVTGLVRVTAVGTHRDVPHGDVHQVKITPKQKPLHVIQVSQETKRVRAHAHVTQVVNGVHMALGLDGTQVHV